MILEVEHLLRYTYSDYVNLNPQYFYLTPNLKASQRLISNEIIILPQAEMLTKNTDIEGNIQHICFVNIPTKTFEVITKFQIETAEFNPYDFVMFPFESSNLPFDYPGSLRRYAETYFNIHSLSKEVRELADFLAKKVNYQTLDFVIEVTEYISKSFEYKSRERGTPKKPEYTLKAQEGSCRDFAVLMMALCASQKVIARFVSGYLYGSERHQHELHAWVEVFLPGGGWRGFDPSEGMVVNKNYITLASSLEYTGINPIRGSFRAQQKIDTLLETHIKIKEI